MKLHSTVYLKLFRHLFLLFLKTYLIKKKMLLWLNAHTASEVSLEDMFHLLRKETESSRQRTR